MQLGSSRNEGHRESLTPQDLRIDMREIESLEVYTVNAGSEVKSAENSEDLWKPSFAYLVPASHWGQPFAFSQDQN